MKQKQNIKGQKMRNLLELDHLEIQDMDNEELMKYKKEDLVRLIGQMSLEMHDLETKEI